MSTVSIHSEIGRLRKVMVHRPDAGLEHVTPGKAVDWLYEDIVFLKRMQEEHSRFVDLLTKLLGPDNVYDAQDVLIEVLSNDVACERLAREICAIEGIEGYLRELIFNPASGKVKLTPDEFVDLLLTGVIKSESAALFPPLPNFIFTRDIAAVIGDQVIASTFAKPARRREALLMRYILYRHPLFENVGKIEVVKTSGEFLLSERQQEQARITIEGGDLMIWEDRHVFVGCGERTSERAVQQLRGKLFEAELIDSFTCVFTPKERSAMHLDTICTRISHTEYVAYAPLVSEQGREKRKLRAVRYESGEGNGKKFSSLEKLIDAITPGMTLIPCGDGAFPHDQREQWTDGCNFLALRPGFIVGYDRNTRTTEALRRQGYVPVRAEDVTKTMFSDSSMKVVVLLESGELSRARGGPRCMSFPILRDELA